MKMITLRSYQQLNLLNWITDVRYYFSNNSLYDRRVIRRKKMGRLRTLVNSMSVGESIVAFAIATVVILVVFNA